MISYHVGVTRVSLSVPFKMSKSTGNFITSRLLLSLLGIPQRASPGVPTPYFTPIQPAPSPVPLISPVASNFVNFMQERPQDVKVCLTTNTFHYY